MNQGTIEYARKGGNMLGPLDATPAVGPPLTDQQILDAVGATGYYRGQAGSQSLRQRGYDAIFAALRAEQIPFDTAAAGCGRTVPMGAAIVAKGFGQMFLTSKKDSEGEKQDPVA